MDEYRWANRVVLIFASVDDDRLVRQAEMLLTDPDGLAERDMVVLAIAGNAAESLFGPAPGSSAEALRRELEAPEENGFAVLLVGKDGGVKLREQSPVPLQSIFALIDSMPMRRNEMRRR